LEKKYITLIGSNGDHVSILSTTNVSRTKLDNPLVIVTRGRLNPSIKPRPLNSRLFLISGEHFWNKNYFSRRYAISFFLSFEVDVVDVLYLNTHIINTFVCISEVYDFIYIYYLLFIYIIILFIRACNQYLVFVIILRVITVGLLCNIVRTFLWNVR